MKNNSSHHSCSLEAECVWQKKPQRQGNDSFTSGMVQPSTTDAEKRTLVRLRMRLRAAHNFAGGCIRSCLFQLFVWPAQEATYGPSCRNCRCCITTARQGLPAPSTPNIRSSPKSCSSDDNDGQEISLAQSANRLRVAKRFGSKILRAAILGNKMVRRWSTP